MAGSSLKRYLPISALLLVFVALAGLYNAITPLGEGPDEPGHGQYVLLLARERRLPVQCAPPCVGDVPGSGHHPPLAYLLAAPLVAWLPEEARQIDLPGNRRFTWAGGDQRNAVAHGSREQWPWAEPVLGWHLARLASTAAGAATVLLTYLAARSLSRRPIVPLLAAGLVALNPQFIFTSALINNDALLAALSAALLWLVVDQRPGAALGRAGLIGLALGLALITKQNALLLAPVALGWAALGPAAPRRTAASEQAPHRRAAAAALLRLAAVAGAAAAVSGWWYVRNWRLYGDPLALDLFRAAFSTQAFDLTRARAWTAALAQLHASFWARFGWMNIAPPGWVDWAYTLLGLGGALGLVLAATAARGRRRSWREVWPLVALPALAFGWVLSFALTAGLVAWQGRMLFPALPAIAILLARGLAGLQGAAARTQWIPQRIWRAGSWLLAAGYCALACWLPLGVIRPAYPFHTLPEHVALERLGEPTYGRFARTDEAGAELLGWRLSGEARPGAVLELELMWHALGRQNRDWVVFVHLVNGDEAIVAETNEEPTAGAFPMTQWVAGDWIPDRHTLALPEDLEEGTYQLRVGLWYPETGRRARVYSERGKLIGDLVELTTVSVAR